MHCCHKPFKVWYECLFYLISPVGKIFLLIMCNNSIFLLIILGALTNKSGHTVVRAPWTDRRTTNQWVGTFEASYSERFELQDWLPVRKAIAGVTAQA